MNRPDFSNYLAHFTSNGEPKGGLENNPIADKSLMSAKERLINILREKKILSSLMPWTGVPAVCFTECPWNSLIAHTTRYSPYGIGFDKSFVFSRNGSPALYIRPDHYAEQMSDGKFTKHLWPFITTFAPHYRPQRMKDKYPMPDCDYSHEREWRVPHDFPFDYNNIKFVILQNYQDMDEFPKELKDAIGHDKFILMDNYKKIEELWPVHKF